MTAASAPVVPASPTPLTPSGLLRLGNRMKGAREARQIVGARHGVIHERAGEQLAAPPVVDGVLEERLADPLGDPTLHLALDDRLVEGYAAIVDRRIGGERHTSRVGIDLHLGDVATIGVGLCHLRRLARVERLDEGSPCLELDRALGRGEEREAAVGAGDAESAPGILDVALGGLQDEGRDPPSLGDDLEGRLVDGSTRDRRRARGDGAHADEPECRVALCQADLGLGNAECLCREAAENRGVALAHGLDGEGQAHRTVARKGDLRRLVRCPARMLEKAGDPDAAPPA